MKLSFQKYQGTGNDFVMVDNRQLGWSPTSAEVSHICDRRLGIGADGLILIQDHHQWDFEMIYFNADGSKSLCGNGSRCAIHFANRLGIISSKTTFLTTDGVHNGFIEGDLISFEVFDVERIEDIEGGNQFINNGSPHFLDYRTDLEEVDVKQEGSQIRYSEQFAPDGTNVNFIQVIDEHSIAVRTYERGVEAETLSCGTGVTAAAIGASQKGVSSPVDIDTKGGQLRVSYEKTINGFGRIFLTGPATPVFKGSVDI